MLDKSRCNVLTVYGKLVGSHDEDASGEMPNFSRERENEPSRLGKIVLPRP